VSHLGRWLSALVDGELDGTERDRVLNHVAGCTACRQEANAMRALKRRLTALGDTCAETSIAGRLIELARGDEANPAGAVFRAAALPAGPSGPQPGRGARHLRPGWKIATGSATSALLAIGAVAFVLGTASGQPPAPKVIPSVDSYLRQHSYDAGQAPAGVTAPVGGTAAGGQASEWYLVQQATPAMLDPRRPGTGQFGQLADVVSVTRTARAAHPARPGSARPASRASATAHPTASASGSPGPSPGRSPHHRRSASRSSR
jgi:Putative zinc-finger